jgi:hypothetical protein
MTSTTVTIPRQTSWPRTMAALAAAIVVALIVTVSLIVSHAGHSATHVPAFHSSQPSSGVSGDCLFRLPSRVC